MSPKALPYLKKAGFKRVVAAREMSLPQLKIFCREAEKAEARDRGVCTRCFMHVRLGTMQAFGVFNARAAATAGFVQDRADSPFPLKAATGARFKP